MTASIRAALFAVGLLQVGLSRGQTVTLVNDINPESGSSSYVNYPTVFSGRLFFSAQAATTGRELWSTDGKSSTVIARDLSPSTPGSSPRFISTLGGRMVFSARQSDGCGERFWTYIPGVPGYVNNVKYVHTYPFGLMQGSLGSMAPAMNWLWMSFNDNALPVEGSSHRGYELWLWKSIECRMQSPDCDDPFGFWLPSGTASCPSPYSENFYMVKDINATGHSRPDSFTELNGKVYFVADDGINGRELWVSDGTSQGTALVKNIRAGSASSNISELILFKGKLYFVADDGVKGNELWCTDGTTAGTVMVKDIHTTGDAKVKNLTAWDGKLYFSADNGKTGSELWSSDGTSGKTTLLKAINPETALDGALSAHSAPSNFTIVNALPKPYLVFTAFERSSGREVWRTDGTAIGTSLLKDLNPGAGSSDASKMFALAGKYYYSAAVGTNGQELWEYTPTTNVHRKLAPALHPNSNPMGSSHNWPWVLFNNELYFYASFGSEGGELWKITPQP